jgi:putative flippase GtrA
VRFDLRFIKFVVVGFVNAAFGSGIYALLIFVGSPIWCALFFGNVAGIVFNFFTTGRLVFSGANVSRFPRFLLVYFACYVASYMAIKVLVSLCFSAIEAQLITVVPMAILSFYLMSRHVFARNENDGAPR